MLLFCDGIFMYICPVTFSLLRGIRLGSKFFSHSIRVAGNHVPAHSLEWRDEGEYLGSGECLLPWGSARFGGVKVCWYGNLGLGSPIYA